MVETTTARFSYEGQKFEILVKPDQALEFKLGKRTDITSVLISEDIYTDSSKGNKPSDDMLTKAFKTNDTTKIAEIILKKVYFCHQRPRSPLDAWVLRLLPRLESRVCVVRRSLDHLCCSCALCYRT